MKYLLIAAPALALGIFAAPAFAADAPDSAGGVYGTLGWSGTQTSGRDLNAVQGRLGYRFMNWLGVEGEAAFGVGDTGVAPGTTAHLDNEAGVYAVGFLPVSSQVDLFGRVGWAEDQVSVKGPGGFAGSGNASGVAWGGGAQWSWDGKNGVRGDYTRDEFNHDVHADVWGLSYVRRF